MDGELSGSGTVILEVHSDLLLVPIF